jgi:hypothetical protein
MEVVAMQEKRKNKYGVSEDTCLVQMNYEEYKKLYKLLTGQEVKNIYTGLEVK